jgi:hypothetical protein
MAINWKSREDWTFAVGSIVLMIIILTILSRYTQQHVPILPSSSGTLSGILTAVLIVIGITFIVNIGILAYSISKIYNTEFSLFKALLVILFQAFISLVITLVFFFILGISVLSLLHL